MRVREFFSDKKKKGKKNIRKKYLYFEICVKQCFFHVTYFRYTKKKKRNCIYAWIDSAIANQARPEDGAVELIIIFKSSLQSERDQISKFKIQNSMKSRT